MAGVKRNKCDRAELRKRVILEASRAFAKSGIKNVHMDSLACALSISKRTLYELFCDKEQLLLEVFAMHQQEMSTYISEVASRAENALEVIFAFYKRKLNECLDILTESVKNRVLFLGQCKQNKVYELMYNAAVFVVPSRNEGFGFITAEAMFNGTIVIGKNTGGTKEQMDNGKENTKSEIAFRYINLQNLTDLLFKAQNFNIRVVYERSSKSTESCM
mgnify:CR=1 FL=1